MPLVKHSQLPTFDYLDKAGESIITPENITTSTPKLKIALLNLMPDTALAFSERQFFSLLNQNNCSTAFYLYPFSLSSIKRSDKSKAYIEQYYYSWQDIQSMQLDGIIITGANVESSNISQEVFWQDLLQVIEWTKQSVPFCLFSCLAAHAVLWSQHGQARQKMPEKLWGVFSHYVANANHYLTRNLNSTFTIPHSRFNDISSNQFTEAGLDILIASEQAGVHLATNSDSSWVFMQGHPEYDVFSLLKEYKREVFDSAINNSHVAMPSNYFNVQAQAILMEYSELFKLGVATKEDFPEAIIRKSLINNWHDTAAMVMGNWTSMIYQNK